MAAQHIYECDANNKKYTFAPYYDYPMCLRFCIWGKKPHPSETPVSPSGARAEDFSKAEEGSQPTTREPISHQPAIMTMATSQTKQESPILDIAKSFPSRVEGMYQSATTEGATPQAEQETQIPAVPQSLPSQVDDTLGECPR